MTEIRHGVDGELGEIAGRTNSGKRIVHTFDPKFLIGIGHVAAFGAKKYHMRNFLMPPGIPQGDVLDSALGHLFAYWGGENLDEESGLHHLLHSAWNIMALYTYATNEVYAAGDNRPAMIEYTGKRWKDWNANLEAVRAVQSDDSAWDATREEALNRAWDAEDTWPGRCDTSTPTPPEDDAERPGDAEGTASGSMEWLASHAISEAVRVGRQITVKIVGNLVAIEVEKV